MLSTVTLWTINDTDVHLNCVRCDECGSVVFPPQRYGCEACGADADHLVATTIPAEGTLHAFTTVHRDPKRETPFQVGELLTQARQLVRARISVENPTIGQHLIGRVVANDDDAELVFVAKDARR